MDINYLLVLQDLRNSLSPFFEYFFNIISSIMVNPVIYVFVAGIYWCISKEYGYLFAFNMVGGNICNQIIKNTACVYRPWIRDSRIIPSELALPDATGYSFPSGHTVASAGLFGSIFYIVKNKRYVRILCVIMVLLVAFSRNFLGVHTPQDVIVGIVLGLIVLLFSIWIVKLISKTTKYDIYIMIGGLLISGGFIVYSTFKSYPVDYSSTGEILVSPEKMINDCYMMSGFLAALTTGLYVERRFINFSPEGTVKEKILRFLIGGIIMLSLFFFLKNPLYDILGDQWGRFVFYFLLLFVAFAVYPAIFKYFENKLKNKKDKGA